MTQHTNIKYIDHKTKAILTKAILMPNGWWDTIPIEFEIPVPMSNNVFITKIDNSLEIIDNVKEQQ